MERLVFSFDRRGFLFDLMSGTFAVLLDWDGVVIDSSSAHERSWEVLASETGFVLPEGHFRKGFGMKNERILSEILGWTHEPADLARLGEEKERLYRKVLVEQGVSALPGADVFLRRLEHAGVPFAIASSTSRENIDTVLGLLGWEGRFQAIVSARDVTRGKPDPEVFLKASQLLEVPASKCVVFEDAFVGLIAARAARMKCIGVATTHAAERLRLMADRVVHTLDALTVEDLESMVGVVDRAVAR